MTLLAWKNSGQHFDFQGESIFYQSKGSGETLVLLHGFPTSSWDWEKIWNPLSEKYHVLAPDLLGFGFSDKPKNHTYAINQQADLVETLLNLKGIQSYHLLVHDYSVSVGQELMARLIGNSENNPKILSIAFLNGGLFPSQHRPLLIQKLLKSPIGFIIARLNSKKMLKNSFDKIFGVQKASEEEINDFWTCIVHQDGNLILHKLIGYIQNRIDNKERWENALIAFKSPQILINGPLDPISGQHLANYYTKKVPNANVVLLEGVGHYPQTEAPEALLKAYFNFRNSI